MSTIHQNDSNDIFNMKTDIPVIENSQYILLNENDV